MYFSCGLLQAAGSDFLIIFAFFVFGNINIINDIKVSITIEERAADPGTENPGTGDSGAENPGAGEENSGAQLNESEA